MNGKHQDRCANVESSFVIKLTPFPKMQKRALELMGPTVQKRLDTTWEDEEEKPNDMIQFLIDSATDIDRTMPRIVERMMALNMASIHTTTSVRAYPHARLRLSVHS
jgi:hypothetical protein